jgi:NAD dependent epimerase/dehydratase family enzyme
MSTAHIYGDPPEAVCDEDSSFGWGLAPFVARKWEQSFAQALPASIRGVVLRTSFVLGKNGGALRQLSRVVRCGLGGTVGHGRQGISWIHERDMDRLFERAISDESMRGTYIATAPNPVSNAEFMREMRKALRAPIGLPAASWMVRLAAPLMLRSDPDLALYGRYCVSKRLREEAFEFLFPDVRSAFQDLYRS